MAKLKSSLRVDLRQLPQDRVRNTADFSDWVYQKTKNRKPFYLVGHSFGGQVAVDFTARYPSRVKKLILINSAGVRKRQLRATILLPLAKLLNFLPQSIKYFFYRLIGETDYFKASPAMKETMKLILKEDQQAAMKKIITPTLILWGKNDRYTPRQVGQLTHRLIKNSLWEIYEGGHGLPFTHTKQLAEKILWFLK